MPFYEIQHTYPLNEAQQDQLAQAITHIHSRLFTTPSLFVNVAFTDNTHRPMYAGGKKRKSNMIMAHVRPGSTRTKEHYTQLCNQVGDAWKAAVAAGTKGDAAGDASDYVQTEENKLGAIFVLGTILTGWEGGFMIPDAGKDKEWFVENLAAMKKAAAEGDSAMAEMLQEIATRDDFQSVLANGA